MFKGGSNPLLSTRVKFFGALFFFSTSYIDYVEVIFIQGHINSMLVGERYDVMPGVLVVYSIIALITFRLTIGKTITLRE